MSPRAVFTQDWQRIVFVKEAKTTSESLSVKVVAKGATALRKVRLDVTERATYQ